MQCRYCFGDENPESFLAPCVCRGTSQYTHEVCLQRYLRYYPDRMCRVCNTRMEYESRLDRVLPCIFVPVLAVLLMSSEAPPAAKAVLFLSLLGLSALFAVESVFTTGTAIGSLMLGSLVLCVRHDPTLTLRTLGVLGTAMFVWTLVQYVDPYLLLAIFTCTLTVLYTTLFAMAMSVQLDGIALAVFVVQAYLIWTSILQLRPPPHRNPIHNE